MTLKGSVNVENVARVGVVVIGRNEGERLVRCLDSLKPLSACSRLLSLPRREPHSCRS